MSRKKMDSLVSSVKVQHLGKIYRLIEQFDLISRIDLAKISGFAPASITALTRELIENKFVIERIAQTTATRGRPAIGLCVSPFYWQTLCATLVEDSFEISLCELNDKPIKQTVFPLSAQDFNQLESVLLNHVLQFLKENQFEIKHLIAFSIAIAGQLNHDQKLVRVGDREVEADFLALFEPHFQQVPVLVSEYFKTWLFAESNLGTAINSNNVLFLQLDDVINMSVLVKGQLINTEKQTRMNINKVNVPRVSELSDIINENMAEIERHQLHNQVTHHAVYQLIDHLYPDNNLQNNQKKITFLCDKANQGDENAVKILYHVADSVSYVLMNLVNIFSSDKIMISSSLLGAKEIFLSRLNSKLKENLLLDNHHVDIAVSQYEWNSSIVASSAIKQYLYDGALFAHILTS